jgi:teichuronic acid biosynthesis glycosyltransferase TuaC
VAPALRLLTFTTLYPNAAQPNHGIFVENRLRHLVADTGTQASVLAPTWWFPSANPRFGPWAAYARVPRREQRHGLDVHHPRALTVPKLGMYTAPWALYRAARAELRRLMTMRCRAPSSAVPSPGPMRSSPSVPASSAGWWSLARRRRR